MNEAAHVDPFDADPTDQWVVIQHRDGKDEFLQKAGVWLPAETTPIGPRAPEVATSFPTVDEAIRTVRELGIRQPVKIVERPQ